jgi:hypothetical protein
MVCINAHDNFVRISIIVVDYIVQYFIEFGLLLFVERQAGFEMRREKKKTLLCNH